MPEQQVVYEYLHQAQLANIVTGFCTCMAGIMPMVYCLLLRNQPPRWFFVYFCILLTGIPTVWYHANEQSNILGAVDTGSNVFLTWAMQIAIAGDFMRGKTRWTFVTVITAINVAGWTFMGYEAIYFDELTAPIQIGESIYFTTKEVILILNSILVTGLLFGNLGRIPKISRPIMYLVVAMFLVGLFLASAKNHVIAYRIVAWHALWHVWGAAALVSFWFFNHVRFTEAPEGVLPKEPKTEETLVGSEGTLAK